MATTSVILNKYMKIMFTIDFDQIAFDVELMYPSLFAYVSRAVCITEASTSLVVLGAPNTKRRPHYVDLTRSWLVNSTAKLGYMHRLLTRQRVPRNRKLRVTITSFIMATVHGLESSLESFLNRFKSRFERLVRTLSTPDVSEACIIEVINGYVLRVDIQK